MKTSVKPARRPEAAASSAIASCSPSVVIRSATVTDVAIDLAHLAHMTFGERELECDVLRLFDQQAELLLDRLPAAEPAVASALAHTLCGSARGIGAFQVADAASRVERLAAAGASQAELAAAIDDLATTVIAARTMIAGLLEQRCAGL
jgi:hypothetical protein